MYKRKDNDIFGTNQLGYAPRIENNSYVDPNAAFKKKMEENYHSYASKINNISHSITAKPLDSTKVNEKANFEQTYHKTRKEADLQSNIFYPPTQKVPANNDCYDNNLSNSNVQTETNFGRKETLKREIKQLPFNETVNKGNSSKLFDLDERIRPQTEHTIPVVPLIPYKMQWDQHDSVRYPEMNDPTRIQGQKNKLQLSQQLQNIDESKSTYFNQEDVKTKEQKKEPAALKKEEINTLKKAKSEKMIKMPPEITKKNNKEPVEVKILKGWDFKLMEGLSKHSKLNGAAILKFESEEGGKATLVLKRSERWENVTDWLRKDAKLKIRVVNN